MTEQNKSASQFDKITPKKLELSKFADLLRRARNAAGLSQKGLGLKVRPYLSRCSAQQYVWRLEAGKDMPLKSEIPLLAEAVGIPTAKLAATVIAYRPDDLTTMPTPTQARRKVKQQQKKKSPPRIAINPSALLRLPESKFISTANKILAGEMDLTGCGMLRDEE